MVGDKGKTVIFTDQAVKPVGPYSQAVRAGDFLFISGTVPVDPATGKVVEREIRAQAKQVFDSIKALLESVGATMDDLAMVTKQLDELIWRRRSPGEQGGIGHQPVRRVDVVCVRAAVRRSADRPRGIEAPGCADPWLGRWQASPG